MEAEQDASGYSLGADQGLAKAASQFGQVAVMNIDFLTSLQRSAISSEGRLSQLVSIQINGLGANQIQGRGLAPTRNQTQSSA